jgi:4-oxalocrotonate tautomerase
MSTPLLERLTMLDAQAVLCPDPQCASPAHIEDRWNNDQKRRSAMPLINVKLIEGVFTSEQKEQIIERLTDAMVSIEGENMRGVTWVVVEEVNSGE